MMTPEVRANIDRLKSRREEIMRRQIELMARENLGKRFTAAYAELEMRDRAKREARLTSRIARKLRNFYNDYL